MVIISEEKKKEWIEARCKLAEAQGNVCCKYCGAYSGVFRITLRKFYLQKSKKKIYLCQRHWDKSKEVDELIWFMEHPEESGYNDMKAALEKKKQEEILTRRKKIIIIGSISILVVILFIFIFWR